MYGPTNLKSAIFVWITFKLVFILQCATSAIEMLTNVGQGGRTYRQHSCFFWVVDWLHFSSKGRTYSLITVIEHHLHKASRLQISKLVEALCYKLEGRGSDSRWDHWTFGLTSLPHYVLGIDSVSNINEMSTRYLPGEKWVDNLNAICEMIVIV
jgi:hypothetical protein